MSETKPIHDRAVIISSGDEIVTGQLLDTNSRWLAEQLVLSGILPIEHITIPDDMPALARAFRRACDMAPLVIISGGLGPTEGDLTRQALAEVMGDELVIDREAEEGIAAMLGKRGRAMTDRQRRQAYRPSRARCLSNTVGTAPGLHAAVFTDGSHGASDVFCLPGPPGELRQMWEAQVVPALRPDPSRTIITRLLHIVGIPEADCVDRLGDLTRRDCPANLPLVGITASGGILTLRIRYDGQEGTVQAGRLVDEVESNVRGQLGDHVFASGAGIGYEKLASTIIELLKAGGSGGDAGRTLAVVESCTGGMLGEMLTRIPGSSAAFVGGYITYANRMKESLGVSAEALKQHGAVSAEVAGEMALHGLRSADADFCLSITGIAGPEGGTPTKPVGTVSVGLASRLVTGGEKSSVHIRRFLFTGDREDIRRRACVSALTMLYFALRGRNSGEPRLLWEIGPTPASAAR